MLLDERLMWEKDAGSVMSAQFNPRRGTESHPHAIQSITTTLTESHLTVYIR